MSFFSDYKNLIQKTLSMNGGYNKILFKIIRVSKLQHMIIGEDLQSIVIKLLKS